MEQKCFDLYWWRKDYVSQDTWITLILSFEFKNNSHWKQ